MAESIEVIVARIDERTRGMDENLRSLVDRLKAVEGVAQEVREFPSFRKLVMEKIEKYDEACTQAKTCPGKIQAIETAIAAIDSRVEVLEDDGIKQDAKGNLLETIWDAVNKPIVMAFIIILFQIYLHVVGGAK